MKIVIYNEEKGLHNPYSKEDGPYGYTLASFLIDCVEKASELFDVNSSELLNGCRIRPVPDVRGALMLSLYRLLKVYDCRFSTGVVAGIFKKDHSTLCNYIRKERNGDLYLCPCYEKLHPELKIVFVKHFPDGKVADSPKSYKIEDLVDLARFLGYTDVDVETFLTQRT
ncbi:MAG: hypothetical protein QG654_484 [Patescibacteria group bacterium]|jgi:hypothetical protein|nr:hypothetical protein [Patescibacteria group bacterium]